MSNEKVRISFDVKHSVKTVEARDRLREQMKDLTQRQNTLKDLLLKQAELTKSLKQNPDDLEAWSQRRQEIIRSNILTNKVDDWMSKNPGIMEEASKTNHSIEPVSNASISAQVSTGSAIRFSKAEEQVLMLPSTTRMQSGDKEIFNTQVSASKKMTQKFKLNYSVYGLFLINLANSYF